MLSVCTIACGGAQTMHHTKIAEQFLYNNKKKFISRENHIFSRENRLHTSAEDARIQSFFCLVAYMVEDKYRGAHPKENSKTRLSTKQKAQTRCPRGHKLEGETVIPPCSSGSST